MKSKTRVALAVLIPALLALPLLVAACGGGETTTTQTVTTSTQPLTSSTQALTTTTATSSSAALSGNAPVGRSGGVMVFDPTSDRLIMFGGTSGRRYA